MNSEEGKARRRNGRSVTIDDVARHVGVSAMTVSRVLNGAGGASDATRAAVLKAVEQLDFTRNPAAQRLASARAARVGVLYDQPNGAYLTQLLIGLLDEASRSEHQLVLQRCERREQAIEAVDKLLAKSVDGFVLSPPISDYPEVFERLSAAGKPAVGLAAHRAEAHSAVRIDDYAAAKAMTDWLIARGHRRIGFVAGDPDQSCTAERERGYRHALAEAGLEVGPIAQGDFSYRSGIDAAQALLAAPNRPDAIFASNDDMAAAAVSVAHRMGIDVPGALSITGFDDTVIATTTWPELTTVRQPIAEMACAAMEHLVRRIRETDTGDRDIVLPFRIVERESASNTSN